MYLKRENSYKSYYVGSKWNDELWNANPNCDHRVISPSGGGVKCIKCNGWICY